MIELKSLLQSTSVLLHNLHLLGFSNKGMMLFRSLVRVNSFNYYNLKNVELVDYPN